MLPLHQHPEFLFECCRLINDEWKRSETARLRSLESSCDALPVSLVLVKARSVIGHAKLSPIPSIKDGSFVESVVISRSLRGQGFGTFLMQKAEEYCSKQLGLRCIYLSTKGQEDFYRKLGYQECEPISIYGGAPVVNNLRRVETKSRVVNDNRNNNVPKPPPIPVNIVPEMSHTKSKTYMFKVVNT